MAPAVNASSASPTNGVRLVRNVFCWGSLAVGVPLNCFCAWLILRKTQLEMRAYSKILLQTCVTDIIVLIFTALSDNYVFEADGGFGLWNNGLIMVSGADGTVWPAYLTYYIWLWLVYAALYGFVTQFIFRYCCLNRNLHFSACRYFTLLAAIELVPLAYVSVVASTSYPTAAHRVLHDQSVADIFGMNASDVYLDGWSALGNEIVGYAAHFIMVADSIAYVTMLLLGWLMYRHVAKHLRGASNTQRRMLETQRRLTRVLIIQSLLAGTIYFPALAITLMVVFSVDMSGWALGLQYYYILANIPIYLPAALDPLVAILTIRDYKRATGRLIAKAFTRCARCASAAATAVEEAPPIRVTTNTSQFNSNGERRRWAAPTTQN